MLHKTASRHYACFKSTLFVFLQSPSKFNVAGSGEDNKLIKKLKYLLLSLLKYSTDYTRSELCQFVKFEVRGYLNKCYLGSKVTVTDKGSKIQIEIIKRNNSVIQLEIKDNLTLGEIAAAVVEQMIENGLYKNNICEMLPKPCKELLDGFRGDKYEDPYVK